MRVGTCLWICALQLLLSSAGAASPDRTFVEFLVAFLNSESLSSVAMFTCPRGEFSLLVKTLSSSGKRAGIYLPHAKNDLPVLLSAEYYSLGVVVDMRCPGASELLAEASGLRLLAGPRRWLLLRSAHRGEGDWRALAAPPDSSVALAARVGRGYLVRGARRVHARSPLQLGPGHSWSPGTAGFPRPPRPPGDLGGLTLRAGVVVLEDAWENRFDMRRKHLNTWSKISYSLMTYVSEMLNFRMTETQVDSWGYPDERGVFSGLVGLLQRNESDIGAVGCIITTARMRACQYAGETTPFRPRFIFREPPLSSVSNIYTMPFSARVWRVYAATVLLLTAALLAAQRAEASHGARPGGARPGADWGEALLASLGVICQQGCSRTPDGMSSRTLFFVLFILSLFFFTSYSAIIVSLLQSPSSSINTLAELIESPLKIAFDDIVYNHKYDNYVSETSSPTIWKLFHEDILLRPKHQAFLRQEHGVRLMRRGMMAFHVDMSAYKIIADTWNEMDKCDLKEVFMFPAYVFAIPVQTGSPYRELITLKLRWLREAGFISREWRRWATEKPVCEHSTNFISVGLQDFRAALLILVYGVLASLAALLLELGAHHAPRLWRGRPRASGPSSEPPARC